jgi:hypothetical protein
MGLEVLSRQWTTKSTAFWITPCGSERPQRFGGTYCLHLQGQEKAKKQVEAKGKLGSSRGHRHLSVTLCVILAQITFAVFLLAFLLDSEDGGNMFVRKVGVSPNCTLLHPRRPYFYICKMLALTVEGRLDTFNYSISHHINSYQKDKCLREKYIVRSIHRIRCKYNSPMMSHRTDIRHITRNARYKIFVRIIFWKTEYLYNIKKETVA